MITDKAAVLGNTNFTEASHSNAERGAALGGLGTAVFGYLGFIKLFFGEDIGNRPLLTLGMILIIAAVQLLTVGVLAELMTRTYFEAGKQKSYVIRNAPETDRDGWHPAHNRQD